MPYSEVFNKFKSGNLHSGSKSGPTVTNPKQATAIFLSEKKKAAQGDSEYASDGAHKVASNFRRKKKRGS